MSEAIRAAQAAIQAECGRLTDMLRAKGYENAHVEIWVGRYGNSLTAYTDNAPSEMSFVSPTSDIAVLIERVEAAIAKTPDVTAYDAWFAWPQSGEAA